MPVRYKLTDANGYTRKGKYGETKWDKHSPIRITSGEGDLCAHGWTHVYTHPLLAELLDPIHGDYGKTAKLISVNVLGRCKKDRGLKEGWTKVSFRSHETRQKVSSVQVIALGILCAIKVYKKPEFQLWAKNWLSGTDRSANADAHAAYDANAASGDLNLIKLARQAMKIK